MPHSILDTVLLRKEDKEKQEFHPLDVVQLLLKSLTVKEADIVRRRFGLWDKEKETLEMIGALYNVTRERIRQIENQSIQKMKNSSEFLDTMRPVEHLIVSLIGNHGGVMTEEMLFDSLLPLTDETKQNRRALLFILSQLLNDKIDRISELKKYRVGWKLKLASLEFIDTTIHELTTLIRSMAKPQQFEDLFKAFQETAFYRQNAQKLNDDALVSFMHVSMLIAKNPFDEYGLSEWGLILPKRMNDRIYLVLKKSEKPMHFTDIAERISKVFKKKAYPPTVHNELILNERYVLVGRGIYALAEWGFKEGIVARVIVEVLQKKGKPLSRTDIVAEVLKQRIVKKNTIHLALTNKELFSKTAEGLYTLASNLVTVSK
ncbi:MAG TPA: sigma factor-like helix-turn-helix DNA-binding protein [Patescibacteria group bacterium]|nr:sigma factor-like helix-turn-helix DNA-binding protein [Patescibacteria group bacterium]